MTWIDKILTDFMWPCGEYDPDRVMVRSFARQRDTRSNAVKPLDDLTAGEITLAYMLESDRVDAGHAILAARIRANVRGDGFCHVEQSGMDCDGVRYSGIVHKIKNVDDYLDLEEDVLANADGPVHLIILPPGTEVEYQEQDLGTEAFEDGRPHVISDWRSFENA